MPPEWTTKVYELVLKRFILFSLSKLFSFYGSDHLAPTKVEIKFDLRTRAEEWGWKGKQM